MKKLLVFLFSCVSLFSGIEDIFYEPDPHIVVATKKLEFERYPGAFNPSIIEFEDGYLLTFRFCPDYEHQHWLSQVGIVLLDRQFNPISEPQILNTRAKNSKTPTQAEDARVFRLRDKLFLIYNDNVDEIAFDHYKRRDMFISQLEWTDGKFRLLPPLKFFFEEKYASVNQQKNWVPFEWNNNLFLSYSIHPHWVLSPTLKTSHCYSIHKTEGSFDWEFGVLRGGTPAVLVDGEYLAFFHSSARTRSPASYDLKLWHYFMGAYTFSAEPPFELTKISEKPIMGPNFYTPSYYREKRVVFPGGLIDDGDFIHVAYGKDDCEIWIATLDKKALKNSLVPVKR